MEVEEEHRKLELFSWVGKKNPDDLFARTGLELKRPTLTLAFTNDST